VFSSARVTPIGLPEGRNPVPILVTVQERFLERFGSAAVAAGVATDRLPNYAYVGAGWLWSNFFGLGSQLELRGDFGFTFVPPYVYSVIARYIDPRAFGPGWRFDLTGFVRSEFSKGLGSVFTYGLSTTLSRNLTPTLRLYGRYDIYQAQILVPIFRVEGPNDTSNAQDNTVTSKLTAGIAWDRRVGADGLPNPLMPAKGWLLAASVGWASPYLGGQHQFLVVSGQALGLLPFKVRQAQFTLIANLRYDEGIPINEPALPLFERFFAGGDTRTRGYDNDSLKTEIVRSDVLPLSGGNGFLVIPQAGNIRMLSTVELQFPIAKTFLGLPWPWVGSIFWDMGAIADAPNLIRGSDFKHSIGVTVLRILTPVGPLSLEYAYPITQSLAEERWKTNPWYSHYPGRIHFNWGIPLSRL
jgi:outer membrane protein assembly factor BamA